MGESVIADTSADDDATMQAEIGRMLEEVERHREYMKQEQEKIDRLKAHTRAILAQLESA